MSSTQGWKKQRFDPASAPVSSDTRQECVLAAKDAMGLLGMCQERNTGGSHIIVSGMGAVEVVAEVAEASLVGLSDLFSDEEEAAEGD